MKHICSLLLIGIVLFPVTAQLNLKKKFEKKADQVVDDLLFGKKKNKNEDTNSGSSGGEATDTYKSDDDSAPNGGYVRKPVNYSEMSTGKTVHFRQLIDFLPDDVGPFSLADKPDGASMRFGEYSYSYASKRYENGDDQMSIMIYDYLFTGIMGAYANAYEYETTDGIMKSTDVNGYPGWFTTTYESQETQLTLIINNRFMLSINQRGASEDDLRNYAQTMELTKLPEGQAPEEEVEETTVKADE